MGGERDCLRRGSRRWRGWRGRQRGSIEGWRERGEGRGGVCMAGSLTPCGLLYAWAPWIQMGGYTQSQGTSLLKASALVTQSEGLNSSADVGEAAGARKEAMIQGGGLKTHKKLLPPMGGRCKKSQCAGTERTCTGTVHPSWAHKESTT